MTIATIPLDNSLIAENFLSYLPFVRDNSDLETIKRSVVDRLYELFSHFLPLTGHIHDMPSLPTRIRQGVEDVELLNKIVGCLILKGHSVRYLRALLYILNAAGGQAPIYCIIKCTYFSISGKIL